MSVKEKMKAIFCKTLDQTMSDEGKLTMDEGDVDIDMATMLAKMSLRLDALESAMKGTEEEKDVKDDLTSDAADIDEEKVVTTDEDVLTTDDRLGKIEEMLVKLVGETVTADESPSEPKEDKEESDTQDTYDSDLISRAEILAPGIGKSKDMKEKALALAYKTEEGKEVIDSVLGTNTFDSADKHLLFMAASEVLKSSRMSDITATRNVSLEPDKNVRMTPAMLNEKNRKYYSTKGV